MENFHPWHSVHPGNFLEGTVLAMIEIGSGSKSKYEVDKTTGMLKLDRVLHSSMSYPTNYGFIPQTLWDDGDPLDILVLTQVSIQPLSLVDAKIIGSMLMTDNNDADDKIIAVAKNDPAFNHYQSLEELPAHTLDEIKNFFETYKLLEKKTVTVQNFYDKETAIKKIERSIDLYQAKFKK